MIQVRPSPPPPPPQWLVAPQTSNLLFCTPPPPHPCGVVWCGCARAVLHALFPSTLWGGVVWLCPRPGPYCSSSDISGIIIIIHGWYPHKPAVLRGSVPPSPVVWCGVAAPPPCGAASTAAATSIPSGKKSPLSQGSAVFDS